jgi:hypothetical protein
MLRMRLANVERFEVPIIILDVDDWVISQEWSPSGLKICIEFF